MIDKLTKKRMLLFGKHFLTIGMSLLGYESLFSDLFQQDNKWKVVLSIALFSLIIALLLTFIKISCVNQKYQFKKDNLDLTVSRGNIFEAKEGTIIIPVDSGYEDHSYLEDDFITDNSLQFKFMTTIHERVNKRSSNDKYDVFHQDQIKYVLFEVGELNNKKRIYLNSIGEYIDLLYQVCKIINDIERSEIFYLPVIGRRMRFREETNALSSQNRLDLLITVLKMHRFEQKTKINVIVFEETEEDYKLDEL